MSHAQTVLQATHLNGRLVSFMGHTLRSFEIDGARWFVARDICTITGIQHNTFARSRLAVHDPRDLSQYRFEVLQSSGGRQRTLLVNIRAVLRHAFAMGPNTQIDVDREDYRDAVLVLWSKTRTAPAVESGDN